MVTLAAAVWLITLVFGFELSRSMNCKERRVFSFLMAASAVGLGLAIRYDVFGYLPSPSATASGSTVERLAMSGLVNLGLMSAFLLAAPAVRSARRNSWAEMSSPRGVISSIGSAVVLASSILGIIRFCLGHVG